MAQDLFENEQNQVRMITEKWKDVLDLDGLPKISDRRKREVTAVLLENQQNDVSESMRKGNGLSLTNLMEAAPTNSMGGSSSTPGDGNFDIQDPVLINMVRRTAPNLIAHDICGVQPMRMSTGLIFALRSRYNGPSGAEALFDEANTAFGSSAAGNTASNAAVGEHVGTDPSEVVTGGTYGKAQAMSTAALESLGGADDNQFNEMGISVESVPVVAKGKGLKAEYSHQLAQDMRNHHGLDVEAEFADMLTKELMAEINREIVRSIYTTATIGAQRNTQTAGTFDMDVDSNGRWMEEKFKGLLYQCEREANSINKSTRQGKGNFIITSSDVASALNMAGSFSPSDRLEVDDSGNTLAGTIYGRTKVYIDPYASDSSDFQFMTVGYKGSSPWDAGLFYCPYIPLQMMRAQGENTFQPKIAFSTRYGMVAHPFATTAADGDVNTAKKNKYYRLFRIANMM